MTLVNSVLITMTRIKCLGFNNGGTERRGLQDPWTSECSSSERESCVVASEAEDSTAGLFFSSLVRRVGEVLSPEPVGFRGGMRSLLLILSCDRSGVLFPFKCEEGGRGTSMPICRIASLKVSPDSSRAMRNRASSLQSSQSCARDASRRRRIHCSELDFSGSSV